MSAAQTLSIRDANDGLQATTGGQPLPIDTNPANDSSSASTQVHAGTSTG